MSKVNEVFNVKRTALLLGLLVIWACGGSSGSSSDALNKHITTNFNNNSTTDVLMQINSLSPHAPNAGTTATDTYEVDLPTKSSTVVWNVNVTRRSDSAHLASGSFTWDFSTLNANSRIDINFDGTAVTFSPEMKRR